MTRIENGERSEGVAIGRVEADSERTMTGADVGRDAVDDGADVDPRLARIVAAWSKLPAALQGAMDAIVESAGAASGR